jgi:hypothetical protein
MHQQSVVASAQHSVAQWLVQVALVYGVASLFKSELKQNITDVFEYSKPIDLHYQILLYIFYLLSLK